MKKKMFAVLTAVLFIAMSTTAFAGSPTAEKVTGNVSASSSAEVAKEAVTGVKSGDSVIVAAAASREAITTCCEAAKSISSSAQVLAVADYTLVSGSLGSPISVGCAGIVAGDNVIVIHVGKNGTEYIVPDSVTNGMVTFTLNDLSPVAIVKLPAGVSISASKTTASASYKKSPKTGDSALLMVIAAVSLAGFVVCARKVRSN